MSDKTKATILVYITEKNEEVQDKKGNEISALIITHRLWVTANQLECDSFRTLPVPNWQFELTHPFYKKITDDSSVALWHGKLTIDYRLLYLELFVTPIEIESQI